MENQINFDQRQIDSINGFLMFGEYAAGYEYIYNEIRFSSQVDNNTKFWFENASQINRGDNLSASSVFIRSVAENSLRWDGIAGVEMNSLSDRIAQNVLQDIVNQRGIPTLEFLVSRDIAIALDEGGITLGGWGGSFYYWDLPYTDDSGTATIGQRIMGDAVELEKFIAVNAQAAVDTFGVEIGEFFRLLGGDTSGWDGDVQQIVSATVMSDLPPEVKSEVISRVSAMVTIGSDYGNPNVINGYARQSNGTWIWIAGSDLAIEADSATAAFLEERRQVRLEKAEEGFKFCFAAGTLIELADGTRKPIEQIAVGDKVLAFDDEVQAGRGALVSRRVTQLFATPDRAVLDFHGLRVTPGHVFLCGDGPQAGSFRMLLDILCDDGAIVDRAGRLVRAATNGLVGTREDAFVEIAYVTEPDSQAWRRARLRAGTRLCLPEGGSTTVLACLQDEGYRLRSDGLVECDGEAPQPLPWFGVPPRPEDYVLARSGLTLAELYAEAPQRPMPTWPTGARSDVGRAESREPLGDPEVGEGAGAALHFARRAGETLQ